MNESDALGEEYLGMLLSADAGRNTIFGYHPAIKQSGYDLGKRENFITSLSADNEGYVWNDSAQNTQKEKWFRPSDVAIGTDGAIYIADWYDPVVGGHQMKDSIGYGRIYRIAPENKKLTNPIIDLTTTEGQIEALKNPAVNVRNSGFEKLKQQGEQIIDAVKKLLQDENSFIQARAVWLLSQIGEGGKKEVEKILTNADEKLRATAFRSLRQVTDDILPYAKQLSTDTSAFVRREVIAALRDMPFAAKKEILLSLAAQYDGEDRWYVETLGSAMEADAAAFLSHAQQDRQGWRQQGLLRNRRGPARGFQHDLAAQSLRYPGRQRQRPVSRQLVRALDQPLHLVFAAVCRHGKRRHALAGCAADRGRVLQGQCGFGSVRSRDGHGAAVLPAELHDPDHRRLLEQPDQLHCIGNWQLRQHLHGGDPASAR